MEESYSSGDCLMLSPISSPLSYCCRRRSFGALGWILSVAWVSMFIPPSHAQCIFPASSSGNRLTYSFEPVVIDGKLTIHITLEFLGGRGGTAELELPSDWAGQTHLEGEVSNLRVLSRNAVLLDTAQPNVKTLRFYSNEAVTVSYDLVKDWQGAFGHPKQFRAVLEPAFFEFTTQNALVHLKFKSSDVVSVHFDWQRLPADWTVETSFGDDDRCQSFTGFWHKVNEALFAGGDFRIHRVIVGGQPLVVAIRGKWSFTDEDAVVRIEKILAVERAFWHDNDFPYFLVTLAPFDSANGGSDGSAFTNSFWLFLPGQDNFSYDVEYMLAHESFHAWNPLKMGPRREPAESEYWFTEGFTVYYSAVILLRSGLLSLPEYVEIANKRIRDYEASPVKNLSNRDIVARYQENSVNQLPDVRGPIVALWLDAQIRSQSKNKSSLDTVMEALVRDASKHPARELSSERVLQAAGKHLNHGSRAMFRSLVEEGMAIPVPDFPENSCVPLTMDQVSLFDLGFDEDVLRAKKQISAVKPDSEAFKAGVRDGQEVVGMSIYFGDVSKPVRLTVRSDGGRQTIEYFPRGKPISVPQYHLDRDTWPSTPERCTSSSPSPNRTP
jgi:predicted metalloprotease with PDZ domain